MSKAVALDRGAGPSTRLKRSGMPKGMKSSMSTKEADVSVSGAGVGYLYTGVSAVLGVKDKILQFPFRLLFTIDTVDVAFSRPMQK